MPADLTVSVVIPAYNAASFVEHALLSAVRQTLPPLEVIVVDDGSTDGTRDVVAATAKAQPIIRLAVHHTNRGPSAARNTGIRMSRGEWIAVLDADDRFEDTRLERLVGYAAIEHADFIADNLTFVDRAAGTTSRLAFPPDRVGRSMRLDLATFLRHCQGNRKDAIDFGMLKPMMRRRFLEEHALRYDESTRHGEDFLLYFRAIAAGGAFVLVPEPGYIQTERVGSLSGRPSGMSRTVVDYQRMRRDTLSLLAHPAAADPAVRALLESRLDRIGDLEATMHVAQSIRRGRLAAAARTLLTRPGAWRLCGEAARRRLNGVVQRYLIAS